MKNAKIIAIDIQKIEDAYNYHMQEAEKLKLALNSIKKFSTGVLDSNLFKTKGNISKPEKSRMTRAKEICEQALREGKKISTTQEFLDIVKAEGIELSIKGVYAALTGPHSKIKFNRDTKLWEINEL